MWCHNNYDNECKMHFFSYSGIGIIDPPENMVVFTGREAVFTCNTTGAQLLSWRVNGLSVFYTDFVVKVTGQYTNITIPATLENNGTMIQCVAGLHGSALSGSQNATLLIQGECKLHIHIPSIYCTVHAHIPYRSVGTSG